MRFCDDIYKLENRSTLNMFYRGHSGQGIAMTQGPLTNAIDLRLHMCNSKKWMQDMPTNEEGKSTDWVILPKRQARL